MLSLYGCDIAPEDADHLAAALTANGGHASLEAAAAIRWGTATDAAVPELEPELRRAILSVLDDDRPELTDLRRALVRAWQPQKRRTRLARRVHNPRLRDCGCLSDCWCKQTAWGRLARWYVPTRLHSSVSPCRAGLKN